MARKKIGVVELRWTCPKCNALNPGILRLCQGCGAPQPDDVKFELPERQELKTDKEALSQAAAGADIHCPYCGTRNPAGSQACSQCQGDLSEGALRKKGEVLGAFKSAPAAQVACPRCGAANADTATACKQCGASLAGDKAGEKPKEKPASRSPRWMAIVLAAGAALICGLIILFVVLSQRTEAIKGVVQSHQWERSIPIEALSPVEHQDWRDLIPSEAEMGSCEPRERSVQSEPAPNAQEVCGTPYSVDTGSGLAEVVQDCEYHVYDDYCSYSLIEWQQVEVASLSGNDANTAWPNPSLGENQRLGTERSETYTLTFLAGDQVYTYTTTDYNLFMQAQIGSTWTLNVNNFGNVISIGE